MYTFLTMKNEAQEAQEQIRAWARPTGTDCLIGKKLISLGPYTVRDKTFQMFVEVGLFLE